MPFRSTTLPGLYAYRWDPNPVSADVPRLLAEIDAAVAPGAPMAIIAVVGVDAQAPEGAVRQELIDLTKKMMGRFAASCMVVEGEGLLGDTKRLLARAMLAMSGVQRPPIYSTAREPLLGKWCPPFLDGAATLAALKQAGMVTA